MVMLGEESPHGLIPFGKYKGQTVEVLLADQGYLQWLLAQAWFMQRYEQLYTLVLNRGVTPDETPEHNALQLRFLDEGTCLQACRAWQDLKHIGHTVVCELRGTATFEQQGIDVTIGYTVAEWATTMQSYRAYRWETLAPHWHTNSTNWLTLELKPSLGDDYPAVLRKMLGGSGMMLVYERWQSQMPVAQVKQLFARSGKLLMAMEELATYPAEALPVPTEPPTDSK